MKVYELLSDGTLVLLPDFSSEDQDRAAVKVMLPWGRQLLGESVLGFERWTLTDLRGRPLGGEKILCDTLPLELPELEGLRLSAENCRQLRDALLSQIPAPGDHHVAMLTMESLWPDHHLFAPSQIWRSEANVLPQLHFSDGSLQLYWGLRLAHFRHDSAMGDRLSLWATHGSDILHGRTHQIRMWLSPSPVAPDLARRTFLDRDSNAASLIKALGEAKVMAMKSEDVAMIRCEGQETFGRSYLCGWFYLSRALWERLLQRMEPERAVVCVWGHVDGLNAVAEMRRYRWPAAKGMGA